MSKKLQSVLDVSLSPPGRWRLRIPEDGQLIEGGIYDALWHNVRRYREQNGYEYWSEQIFQDCLCRQLPPNSSNCGQAPINPYDFHDADLEAFIAASEMPKAMWSRRGWDCLHRHKIFEDEDANETWQRCFQEAIPCLECRYHYAQFITSNPPDYSSQLAFAKWAWSLHDNVSKIKGKPRVSFEECLRLYPV